MIKFYTSVSLEECIRRLNALQLNEGPILAVNQTRIDIKRIDDTSYTFNTRQRTVKTGWNTQHVLGRLTRTTRTLVEIGSKPSLFLITLFAAFVPFVGLLWVSFLGSGGGYLVFIPLGFTLGGFLLWLALRYERQALILKVSKLLGEATIEE
jgi:hypothetical protein